MQLKTLRNVTSFEQSIVFKGTKLTLDSGEESTFPLDVATLFLEECDGLVQEVTMDDIEAQFGIEEPLWIANVTGAPWLRDKEVTRQRYDRKERRNFLECEPMENSSPMPVKWVYQPGMQEYMGTDGGLLALNLFPQKFTIPPFRRLQVPMDIGRWMLRRDRQQLATMQGCLIKSRKPSHFEPDESWPLDEMRLYLQFLDSKADTGRSEAQLRAWSKNKKGKEKDAELEVRRAKRGLMKELFYYLVNPKCKLPTKVQFEEWKKGAPLDEEEQFAMSDLSEWERADTRAVTKLSKDDPSQITKVELSKDDVEGLL